MTTSKAVEIKPVPKTAPKGTGKVIIPTKKTDRDTVHCREAGDYITTWEANDPLRELVLILKFVRGTGCMGEAPFLEWLRSQLGNLAQARKDTYFFEDKYNGKNDGNLHCKVVSPDPEKNKVIFSSHVDTVAFNKGKTAIQNVYIDAYRQEMFVDSNTECLGADDGVGVWIMLNMIRANVPGYYIFHRDEEMGGVGSTWLMQKHKEKFKNYNSVIAFDRKGYNDVITHQGGNTCSTEFATELALRLNQQNDKFKFAPSAQGLFTDSAVYADEVPECTNLSVGYFLQHGSNEYLDYGFAEEMMEAACKMDWSGLPCKRDPVPLVSNYDREYGYAGYSSTYGTASQHSKMDATGANLTSKQHAETVTDISPLVDRDTINGLIYQCPDVVGDILESMEFTENEFIRAIEKHSNTNAMLLELLANL